MTVGPDGTPLRVEDRLTEILARYPAESPVIKLSRRLQTFILDCVSRTEAQLSSINRRRLLLNVRLRV